VTPGGVRWEVRFPKPTGRLKQRWFRTKHSADAFARELENVRAAGGKADMTITYDTVVKAFATARYGALSAGSAEQYTKDFARAAPYMGGKALRAISAADIEQFRESELLAIRGRQRAITAAALARAERRLAKAQAKNADTAPAERKLAEIRARVAVSESAGIRSVNAAIRSLRTLLKFAQSRSYVSQNVATFVHKLKPVKAADKPMEAAVLTPAEITALIAATAPDWRPAIAVLAYGGLRIGELLGLTWGDIELNRGRLLVRRQLCGDTGVLREPKTARSQRFVELPSATISALKAWKLKCPKGELELVFPNTEGGPANHYNFRGRVFVPALRRAGLRRVRVHDMRHTCASLLIAAGCDIAAVSRQLGHANVATTLAVYSHWFAKRSESGLGARLEAFVTQENAAATPADNSAQPRAA